MRWWPRERPVRTIIGFLGIAIGATVAHSVRFDRTAHIPAGGRVAGEPLDLARWNAAHPELITALTAAIMAAIRALVEQARGAPSSTD
jgi:hypothetical protein